LGDTILLIEPQGIETIYLTMYIYGIQLLIEPQGIETYLSDNIYKVVILLIEPQGIETAVFFWLYRHHKNF